MLRFSVYQGVVIPIAPLDRRRGHCLAPLLHPSTPFYMLVVHIPDDLCVLFWRLDLSLKLLKERLGLLRRLQEHK